MERILLEKKLMIENIANIKEYVRHSRETRARLGAAGILILILDTACDSQSMLHKR